MEARKSGAVLTMGSSTTVSVEPKATLAAGPEQQALQDYDSREFMHSATLEADRSPLTVVVLGASGDLAKKKTFPALFNLYRQGFLPVKQVKIVGYARSKLSDDELRGRLRGYLKVDQVDPTKEPSKVLEQFLGLVSYTAGAYDSVEGFKALNHVVADHEAQISGATGPTRRLFYLALPPSVYPQVSAMVSAHCMNQRGWSRVIVEKPFGKDLQSSEELSQQLGDLFQEDQLYRIDHYLGKEIVQNLLVMRFANRFFVPLWNRDNIDNVQIVFREDFGTEGRGGYFDEYGIIRDIIQNHLLQVLCLVAMEKPVSLDPEHIRDEKVKVLKAITPIKDEDVVLGQYEGYKDDPTVPKDSVTPTFATIALHIHNERWDGVPFIMKAGKALDSRKAEIRVQFKDVPGDIFKCNKQGRNEFVMRLQPSEAMYMKLTVKNPGLEMRATQSELDLSYKQRYQDHVIPEAYERLLLDTIRGDHSHFVRRDELRVAWEIFTPLLHRIDAGELLPKLYKPGGRGPEEADQLVTRLGYRRTLGYIWIPPTLSNM
eukprot:TRINITY_DN225_c0_g3_i1.p1 TRINITY_DN225_c0_g3~~TRINITY_DN225_c0_g3_i1.p1  ORF type:complete len:543 (+),score=92.64 TRINITY_DN225_c0_g3_i1:262-1890(+)